MAGKIILAVYGTMKRGHVNHWRVKDQEFIGTAFVRDHELYDIGHAPAAVERIGSQIPVELYRVHYDRINQIIDLHEGVHRGIYRRKVVELSGHQIRFAQMYDMSRSRIRNRGAEKIAEGVWDGR